MEWPEIESAILQPIRKSLIRSGIKLNGAFNTSQQAEKFVNFLKKDNIIVNHGNGNSNIGLDYSFVRITIGNLKQINILSQTISKYQLISL